MISAEEYKKKVTDLRNKVNISSKRKKKIFDDVAKQRSKAKAELLEKFKSNNKGIYEREKY